MSSDKLVVIVDDDKSLVVILNHWFKVKNHTVKAFGTGGAALKFLLDEKNLSKISLVVLDRMLPDIDGLEILERFVKAHKKRPPVLILSALSSNKDVVSGIHHGAVDYVTKPFNQEVFMQKALKLME